MAMRTSGTHCNFCMLTACAAANVVPAASPRHTDMVNFAAVDLLMVWLRQNAGSDRGSQTGAARGPAQRRDTAPAGLDRSPYRETVLLG